MLARFAVMYVGDTDGIDAGRGRVRQCGAGVLTSAVLFPVATIVTLRSR